MEWQKNKDSLYLILCANGTFCLSSGLSTILERLHLKVAYIVHLKVRNREQAKAIYVVCCQSKLILRRCCQNVVSKRKNATEG